MVRADIPGIFCTYKNLSDGTRKRYWYHRATGRRLNGEPGSPEFIADLAKAEDFLKSSRHGNNFIGLIRDFTLSVEFETQLAPATQREYCRMLTKAEAKFGVMPIGALDDYRVRTDFLDWRQAVARKSGNREGDNRLSAISAMLTWAVDHGRIATNHLKGFKRIYHSDRSEKIWLPEQIDAFMRVAPLEMQRALILALHTGQRQGNILKLTWSNYDGGAITLRQNKYRRRSGVRPPVTIPCTAALRRMLDAMPRTAALILTTKTGLPFKKRYFADKWEEATIAAGIEDRHFNDLRGTAVTMLSEAGCTPQQIADITGWSTRTASAIIDRYLARTRGLADQAIFAFENSPRTEFANRLQTGASAPRLAKGKGNE